MYPEHLPYDSAFSQPEQKASMIHKRVFSAYSCRVLLLLLVFSRGSKHSSSAKVKISVTRSFLGPRDANSSDFLLYATGQDSLIFQGVQSQGEM